MRGTLGSCTTSSLCIACLIKICSYIDVYIKLVCIVFQFVEMQCIGLCVCVCACVARAFHSGRVSH